MEERISDEILLKQFKAGDEKAFYLLVERYEKPMTGYLYGISSNMELSKDVCQDTFLKLIHRPPGFLFGGRLKPWLYRSAKNLLIDNMRRDSKSEQIDEGRPEDRESLPDPHESIAITDDIKELHNVLKELDENYREIVVLHFFSGLTFREIAENMNIPIGTALWRMRKAISIMQEIYEKR